MKEKKKQQREHHGRGVSDLADVVGGTGGVDDLLQNVAVSSGALQGCVALPIQVLGRVGMRVCY